MRRRTWSTARPALRDMPPPAERKSVASLVVIFMAVGKRFTHTFANQPVSSSLKTLLIPTQATRPCAAVNVLDAWLSVGRFWVTAEGISSTNAGGAMDRARRRPAAGTFIIRGFATGLADSISRFSLPCSKCGACAVGETRAFGPARPPQPASAPESAASRVRVPPPFEAPVNLPHAVRDIRGFSSHRRSSLLRRAQDRR